MKKLILVIAAIAMVVAFAPAVQAGETAQLGLQVTFASNEPLTIWSEPEGPFIVETGKTVEFKVIAEDKDTTYVVLKPIQIPEGAEWIPNVHTLSMEPRTRDEGLFRWTPKVDMTSDQTMTFYTVFEALNREGEKVKLEVAVTVRPVWTISIELNEPYWKLDGVKLEEKRVNLNAIGVPIHMIKNTGNVSVIVDIGYGPTIFREGTPQPGLEQGLDTFVTMVFSQRDNMDVVIPPNGRVRAMRVKPDEAQGLRLTYGAPTKLSQPVQGMSAAYELRAYPPMLTNDEG